MDKSCEIGQGKYYLYRHIRLDTNDVFYVGIGTKCTFGTFYKEYARSLVKNDRNSHWKNIIKKSNYRVEILLESNNYDFILEKEKEFIKLYGRIDLGTGTLVNFTEGGEGMCGFIQSEEHKKKISLSVSKNQLRSEKHKNSIPIYQYSPDGNFVKKWNCSKDVNRELGYSASLVQVVKESGKVAKGNKWFKKYQGDRIKPFYNEIEFSKRPVIRLDIETNEILEEYNTVKEAAKLFSKSPNSSNLLVRAVNTNKTFCNYNWKYKE